MSTGSADGAELAVRLSEATRRAERVAVINHVGRLITSSLSLDDILETAITSLAEHLHYHNIAVMLVDPADAETLVLRRRAGVYASSNLSNYRQSVQDGIAGAAARSRQALLVNDVRNDPRYIPIPTGRELVSELAIPLVTSERLVGLLNIESERQISEEDAADFETIAFQLAIAVENARLFGETRASLEDARLLYETSRRISEATDIDEVVAAYLAQVAARGRYVCSVVLYDFDESEQPAAVVVRGSWSPATGTVHSEERILRSRDAFDPELDKGRAVLITDYQTDERVSEEFRIVQQRRQAPRAMAMIPLMAGGRRIGLVILSNEVAQEWTDADLHPYQVTAAQLAAVIENRRQQRLLSERDRRLAILEERQRLARDLHDAVIQSVFSVSLIAQSIMPAVRRDPEEGERRVARLVEQSLTAMKELRAVLAELQPSEALPEGGNEQAGGVTSDDEALVLALRRLVAGLADHEIAGELHTDGYILQPAATERALYRICQEALSNVVKHASAAHVSVQLTANQEHVIMTVTDDGVGFEPELETVAAPRQDRSSGIGLDSMRGRMRETGGTCTVSSAPGLGTTVTASLPRRDGGA